MWALAAVASVVTLVLDGTDGSFKWFAIALGACVLLAFGIQLAGPTRPGLVDRLAMSVGGAVLILGCATATLVPFLLLAD